MGSECINVVDRRWLLIGHPQMMKVGGGHPLNNTFGVIIKQEMIHIEEYKD